VLVPVLLVLVLVPFFSVNACAVGCCASGACPCPVCRLRHFNHIIFVISSAQGVLFHSYNIALIKK